jgi:hypothetical protein
MRIISNARVFGLSYASDSDLVNNDKSKALAFLGCPVFSRNILCRPVISNTDTTSHANRMTTKSTKDLIT